MNRDEMTIDLREMVLYVIRKWKVILISMVVLAFLCNIVPFISAPGENDKEVEKAQEAIEKTNDVKDVDDAFAAYAKYKKQYNNTCDYIKNSVIMELDSAAIATDTVVYAVTSEKAIDIAKALTNFTADDELSKNIANVLGCNAKYVGELIHVDNKTGDVKLDTTQINLSTDSAVVVLSVYSPEEDKLGDMSGEIKKAFEEYADVMHDSYGDFDFKCVADQVGISASDDVASKQQNVTTSLDTLKTSMNSLGDSFTDKQKSYFDALKNNMNSNDESKSSSYINVKYIILGAAAGCFLCVVILAIMYILMRKVKAVSDISDCFNIDIIGNIIEGTNQSAKDIRIDYISTQLQVVSSKKSDYKMVFTSTLSESELNGVAAMLKDACKGKTTCASYEGSIISDSEALRNIENADGVVLIEKLFKTKYEDLESEILLCKRINVPIIGCVVVK